MRTHGNPGTYRIGCRCGLCVEGFRAYYRNARRAQRARAGSVVDNVDRELLADPVSYTHLTLPTN